MAGLTVVPESASVSIVTSMAGVAVAPHRIRTRHLFCMTRVTFNIFVRAGERETGVHIMVELPGSPTARVMTAATLIAERALVHVIFAVTRRASAVGIVERHRRVALRTGNIRVRADQRKTRDVMIEADLCDPARRNMTALTLLAELAEMQVIASVTFTASDR